MDIHEFQEIKKNASIEDTIAELLVSVASEEVALANIMNATADTLKALATMISNPDHNIKTKEINFLCKSVNNTLETIVMKEWILSKRLDNIFEIMTSYNGKKKRKGK